MAEFFFDSGLFLTKALIIALLVGALVAMIISALMRQTGPLSDHIEVTRINDRLDQEKETIELSSMDRTSASLSAKRKRATKKAERKAKKKAAKKGLPPPDAETAGRIFVVDFDGDLQASSVSKLRRALTAVLASATPEDEVVVRLDSGGGLVHSYGLAASQLERVKSRGIPLTVCVDKVAASGGYMMACVASKLVAAPFAVLGSIGVVAQLPNIHRLLKKHDVDVELLTAGQYKRTLTVLGENTPEGRAKFQADLEDTHTLFKEWVAEQRPQVPIEEVSTGEIWLGKRALDLKLVDELKTSDEYLQDACERGTVLEVKFVEKQSLQDKLMSSVESSLERTLLRVWDRVGRGSV